MMTSPSIRTNAPPGQDESGVDEVCLLGEYSPAKHVRLTLHARDDKAVLWRHRSPGNSGPAADPAAHITYADGVVNSFEWDDWHRQHKPVWMPSAEDWVRQTIAEAAS